MQKLRFFLQPFRPNALPFARVLFVILLVIVTLISTFGASDAGALGLNDVTVLLPLPYDQADADHNLLKTDEFVPATILRMLPAPVFNSPLDHETDRAKMRIVGLRFDPCFAEGEPPFKCRHQIRLVFQPILIEGENVSTTDAAFHVFFDFNDQDWQRVMADWKLTANTDANSPLQVHPQIRLEGLSGKTWAKLRRLVLKYCSSKNLTRVTGSSVSWLGNVWQFRGVEIDADGKPHMIQIATLGRNTVQSFMSDKGELQEFLTQLAPAPSDEPKLLQLVHDSVGARQTMSPHDLVEAYQSALKIENPASFNPGNRDCASCHIAQTIRLWGEANIASEIRAVGEMPMRFASRFPLENRSEQPFNTNRIRAFGYFLWQPILSQRVINESAAVADTLSVMINSGAL